MFTGATFTTMAPPGYIRINGLKISNGNIAGLFTDLAGGPYPPISQPVGTAMHGFIWNGSIYTTIDYPGFNFTQVTAMSGGDVAGCSAHIVNGLITDPGVTFSWH